MKQSIIALFIALAACLAARAQSGTLPVMYINVYIPGTTDYNDEVISKDLDHKNYFDGEYWLDLNGCQWMMDMGAKDIGSEAEPLPLQIKARGNYTRTAYAKKPFKIKLGKKADLLGLTPDKSKHYALMAHADDEYAFLRNFLGFDLGQRIGLPWTPSQQPVELVINGDYRGLYFLTESIRVGDGRIEIEELDDLATDPALISGGYVVELDNYTDVNQIRMDEKSCVSGHKLDRLRVTFDTPEKLSDLQMQFIDDQFHAMNDLVGSCDDALWSYMDLDDAVRYYIVKEVMCDTEAYHGSTYLFRDRGEGCKWHFSPLWDFGQAFLGSADKWFYDCDPYGNTWIPSIRTNKTFNDKLRATWLWFRSECYPGVVEDADEYIARIAKAAIADADRWRDAPVPDKGRPVCDNSDSDVRRDRAIARLEAKAKWMDSQIGTPKGGEPEPARDTTPAAPLPDYAKAAVDDMAAPSDVLPEYYDVLGRRLSAPVRGTVCIERRGTATRKIIF